MKAGWRQSKGLGSEEAKIMGRGLLTCAAGEDENVDGIFNLGGVRIQIIYKTSVLTSHITQSVSIITNV